MLLLLGGDRSLSHTDTNLYVMGRTPYYCSLPTWLSLTWQTGLITIYGCEKPSFPLGFLRCYPVGSDGVPYCWSQFTSIRSLSLVQLFVTPWTVACQASLPITSSQSLLKLMSIEWVDIQASHPLSSPSPPTFNLSQHQDLFQWVSSLHQTAKVLEFQC